MKHLITLLFLTLSISAFSQSALDEAINLYCAEQQKEFLDGKTCITGDEVKILAAWKAFKIIEKKINEGALVWIHKDELIDLYESARRASVGFFEINIKVDPDGNGSKPLVNTKAANFYPIFPEKRDSIFTPN